LGQDNRPRASILVLDQSSSAGEADGSAIRCARAIEARLTQLKAAPAVESILSAQAAFSNGVLTITLPKTAEAQKPDQKVEIRAA
jgi:hypothetical protein